MRHNRSCTVLDGMCGQTRCAARVAFYCAMAFQCLNMLASMSASVASTMATFCLGRRKNDHVHGLAASRTRAVQEARAGPQRRHHPTAPAGRW
eukprot:15475871-Alexandrium_andersonii.AAC.1